MKFTVITPTYNAAKFVLPCIRSVAAQAYPDWEHIIIDNASTDGTVEIIRNEDLSCFRLRVVSEPDEGIYDAMNKGMKIATGDYIYFLGADDRLAPEVFQSIFNVVSVRAWDVVYGNVKLLSHGWGDIPEGTIYDGPFDLNKLLHKNICHQAIFYSRGIIKKVGVSNTNYRHFADWEYNLRCFAAGEFRYIDIIIADYHTEGRSARADDDAFHKAFFEVVKRQFGISVFSEYFRKRAEYLAYCGRLRLKRPRHWNGLIYYLAAIWHSPQMANAFLMSFLKKIVAGIWRQCTIPKSDD